MTDECADDPVGEELAECPACERLGLRERIENHDCPLDVDDVFEFIAPREDGTRAVKVLSEMLAHVHTHATWLGYYDLRLYKIGFAEADNVWDVHTTTSRRPIEVLNCGAFRSASELQDYLDDLREHT